MSCKGNSCAVVSFFPFPYASSMFLLVMFCGVEISLVLHILLGIQVAII